MSSNDGRAGHGSEFFFVHVGSFVAVIVYFVLHGVLDPPEQAVRIALPSALLVMSGYMLAAHRRRLLKHFDFGLWTMFALGTIAVLGGWERARLLFAEYSAAILFTTLGLVAAVPQEAGVVGGHDVDHVADRPVVDPLDRLDDPGRVAVA